MCCLPCRARLRLTACGLATAGGRSEPALGRGCNTHATQRAGGAVLQRAGPSAVRTKAGDRPEARQPRQDHDQRIQSEGGDDVQGVRHGLAAQGPGLPPQPCRPALGGVGLGGARRRHEERPDQQRREEERDPDREEHGRREGARGPHRPRLRPRPGVLLFALLLLHLQRRATYGPGSRARLAGRGRGRGWGRGPQTRGGVGAPGGGRLRPGHGWRRGRGARARGARATRCCGRGLGAGGGCGRAGRAGPLPGTGGGVRVAALPLVRVFAARLRGAVHVHVNDWKQVDRDVARLPRLFGGLHVRL